MRVNRFGLRPMWISKLFTNFFVLAKIYNRVQWFLYFQNETHTVVLYDLRSPNPKYDPLKLRFSIWARPLKVLPFLIYILSIWISRRQWRQRRRRDKSAGSTHTFSRRVPAIVINHWFYCKLGLLWRLKRCELPPPLPERGGPAPAPV